MSHTEHITAEYDGTLVSFTSDAWIDATAVARKYGKEPNDWLRQRDIVEYLVELGSALGISGCQPEFKEINKLAEGSAVYRAAALRLAKKTGLARTKAGSPVNGGGTLLHPKAGVALARWVNTKFAVWCDMQIDRILRERVPPQEIDSPSTVRDREPILIDSVLIMTRHRIPLPTVYRGLSQYVGVDRFRSMTCGDVAKAHQFAERMLTGQNTNADWRQLQINRAVLTGEQTQLELGSMNLMLTPRRLIHAG